MFLKNAEISFLILYINFELEFKCDEKLLKIWGKINSINKSTRWISIKFTSPLDQSMSIYWSWKIYSRGTRAMRGPTKSERK